jgi:hypothetical protein
MKTIRLLTCLSSTGLLLTSCAWFGFMSINEADARTKLNNIKTTQQSADFALPRKVSVTTSLVRSNRSISFGYTVIEDTNTSVEMVLDLDNYYFSYSFTNNLVPFSSFKQSFYVKDGVFFMVKEDNETSSYKTISGLKGKEAQDYLLLAANNRNIYDYVKGVAQIEDSYRILDFYSNGMDAYRDSLVAGSKVNTFEYDFRTNNNNGLELEEALGNEYDYVEDENHGENDFRSAKKYVFEQNMLTYAHTYIKEKKNYYYQDTLIALLENDETGEIKVDLSANLVYPDLNNFIYNENLEF